MMIDLEICIQLTPLSPFVPIQRKHRRIYVDALPAPGEQGSLSTASDTCAVQARQCAPRLRKEFTAIDPAQPSLLVVDPCTEYFRSETKRNEKMQARTLHERRHAPPQAPTARNILNAIEERGPAMLASARNAGSKC
eukprot:1577665-Rhodomonas_salina.2